ncbi:MAG: hypothetical protein V7644_1679 [Actinomycetota bacterium]|jgi:hypothetical protein
MGLVGDSERERASALLRRHYLEGRLTVEELADRLQVALRARDDSTLRGAVRGLPAGASRPGALESSLVLARRAAVVALKTLVWLAGSLVLLIAFAVWLLLHGPQLEGLLGFPLVWFALTWLLWFAGGRKRQLPAARRR